MQLESHGRSQGSRSSGPGGPADPSLSTAPLGGRPEPHFVEEEPEAEGGCAACRRWPCWRVARAGFAHSSLVSVLLRLQRGMVGGASVATAPGASFLLWGHTSQEDWLLAFFHPPPAACQLLNGCICPRSHCQRPTQVSEPCQLCHMTGSCGVGLGARRLGTLA